MNASNPAASATPNAPVAVSPSDVVLSAVAERALRYAFSRSDFERVEHLLLTIRRALRQLEEVGSVNGTLLERNSTAGLVIERVLANLMEIAFDINCHVSRNVSGHTPETFSESCDGAVGAGLLDTELASRLLPEDGPHHVVMQLCLDADPDRVESVVAEALSVFQEYERRATAWVGGAVAS